MKHIPALFLLLFISLTSGCSSSMTEEQHAEKAKAYLQKGDTKAALIELKNALQLNPEHQSSRLLLGKLYLEKAEYSSAEKELAKAQKLGASDQEVLADLSIALVRLRKHDELKKLNSAKLNDAEKAIVLASQGLSLLQQNKPNEAYTLTSQAVKLNNNSPYTHTAQANVFLITEPNLEVARTAVSKALEIDKNYVLALSLLGDIEAREKNFKAAIDAYTKAIAQSTANYAEMNKRAMAAIYSGDLSSAQQDIDVLKKAFPNHPAINYAQGLIHFESNKLDDAKSAFEGALTGVEQYPMTLFHLGNITYKQGNLSQAETYAEQFFSGQASNILGRKLLALIKYKNNKIDEVEPLLAPILEQSPDDIVALNLLAHSHFKQNKTDSAIQLLRKVAELDPKSTEANINLASGLIKTGEEKQGFALLEETAKLDSASTLPYTISILSHLNLKQYNQALEVVSQFKQKKPDSEIPFTLEGMIYLSQKKLDAAKKAFNKSREIKKDNPAANLNLARIALSKNELNEAALYYNEILSFQRNHLDSLLGLAGIQEAQGDPKKMEKTLEQAINAHPKAFQPRVNLARYYIEAGESSKVPGLIETLDSEIKNIPDVKELLIHLHISKKEYDRAENLANQLTKQIPNSAIPHFLLSQVYAGMGDAEKTEAALKKAVETDPNYVPARIVNLRKILRSAEIATLQKEIKAIKELAPENEDVIQLEYTITRISGRHDEAENLAESLHSKYPNWTNRLMLAKQKLGMGNQEAFVELHNDWLENNPNHIPALLSLASYYQGIGQDESAVKAYTTILNHQPDNIIILNNLAWIMRKSDTTKALDYAIKANKLKKQTPALMDTLAMVYLENNDLKEARKTIKDVLFIDPKNKTYQYHQALIIYRSGQSNEAKALLSKLLEDKAAFSGRRDAEALLASIK
ncbi:MAG: PEP-CTERM system TPR-repeat protein PrsT [Sedimenticola sp.]|nr:PEP-CTERM system TPR-repeat protein PrsT [Sedimenticola sp.]